MYYLWIMNVIFQLFNELKETLGINTIKRTK